MGKIKRLHLVSVIILVMFLLFALGSIRYGSPMVERENLGDGVVRETYVGVNFGEGWDDEDDIKMHDNPRVIESKRDDQGLRHGEYLSYYRDKTGHYIGTYESGVRHGWFYYYTDSNPPDDLTGKLSYSDYYEGGRRVKTEWTESSFQAGVLNMYSQSFVYLDENWPWFIYEMEQGNISKEKLNSFITEVEKKVEELVAHASGTGEEAYIEAFELAVETVGQAEDFNSVYEEYIYIASFEDESSGRRLGLRLAIFDWSHGKGTSVYQILEDDYPESNQALLDKDLHRSEIEEFVNELERRLENKGPLDLEDPLYVFSLEDRIEEAVNEIDGYNTVKRALRDLLFDLYHEGDPLLQSILQTREVASFSDVSVGHTFFTEIEALAAAEIVTGYDDGSFKPSNNVTRMATAAFLYRALELTDPGVTVPTFSDVPTTHPFFKEIEALATSGIVTGYPDGTFKPSAEVTRMATAAFLYRAFGLTDPGVTVPTFSDVPTTHPFFKEIEALAASGITTGYPDDTFRPSAIVNRMAMAAFLSRGLELEE